MEKQNGISKWYGTISKFLWTDAEGKRHLIEQGDGGEQGDALMPALFCLALQPALTEIQSRLPPGNFVFAYLDDIYIVCSRALVKSAFEIAKECLLRTCSIDINLGKLAAWSKSVDTAPEGIQELNVASEDPI